MATGIIHQFPGGTKAQYEASLAAVHLNPGALPDGQTFHAAGATPDGWLVFAIHDSLESWETFRDGILMPSLAAGIDGGFAGPPIEIIVELDRVMP